MIVLALLLAIVLRSLVAPIYLVVSVGLSYLASLGLAVLVFELIGGQDGINFVLPFFMFIFIMALGQDYNILVMTRIREEAHHAPIRVAVRRARRGDRHHGDVGRAHPGRDLRRADGHRQHPGPGDRARAWPRGSCSTPSSSAPCWSRRWWSCWAGGTGGRRGSPARTTATTRWCPTRPGAPARRRGESSTSSPGRRGLGRRWPARPPGAGRLAASRPGDRSDLSRPGGRASWRKEYGERAWPADGISPSRPTVVLLVRHGKTPTTGKVLPGPGRGPPPVRRGPRPRPRRWPSGSPRWRAGPARPRWPSTPPLWSAPPRRPSPSPGNSGLRVRTERGLLECDFGRMDRGPAEGRWPRSPSGPRSSGARAGSGSPAASPSSRCRPGCPRPSAAWCASPGGDSRGRVPRRSDQGRAVGGGRYPPRSLPTPDGVALLGVGPGLQRRRPISFSPSTRPAS